MSIVVTDRQNIVDIADAVRSKLSVVTEWTIGAIPSAIESISGGGGNLTTLTVIPTTRQQTFPPASFSYDGYSAVTVNAVTSAIDPAIRAENIAPSANILGVNGTYTNDADLDTAADLVKGVTAYAQGAKIQGGLKVPGLIRVGTDLADTCKLYINNNINGYNIMMQLAALGVTSPLNIFTTEVDGSSNRVELNLEFDLSQPYLDMFIDVYTTVDGVVKHICHQSVVSSELPTVGAIDLTKYITSSSGLPLAPSIITSISRYAVDDLSLIQFISTEPLVYDYAPAVTTIEQGSAGINSLYFNVDNAYIEAQVAGMLPNLTYTIALPIIEGQISINSCLIGFGNQDSSGQYNYGLFATNVTESGLGDGYLIFWYEYDSTTGTATVIPVYSTATFDASAYIPGLAVTTIGWQRRYLGFSYNLNIDAEQFLSAIWIGRAQLFSPIPTIFAPGPYGGIQYTLGATGVIVGAKVVDIPAIPNACFVNVSTLTTLDLTNASNLSAIWHNAFNGCTSLSSVTPIPATATLYNTAFNSCGSLKNIEVGANTIRTRAFDRCTGLEKIWLRDSVHTIVADTAGNGLFRRCTPSKLHIYVEASTAPAGWAAGWSHSGTGGLDPIDSSHIHYGITSSPF